LGHQTVTDVHGRVDDGVDAGSSIDYLKMKELNNTDSL
jgi:hypothetical protein